MAVANFARANYAPANHPHSPFVVPLHATTVAPYALEQRRFDVVAFIPPDGAEFGTGLVAIGARGVFTPAGAYQYRALMELDDDPGFPAPDSYTAPWRDSGHSSTVDALFRSGGLWWLQTTAELDDGVTLTAAVYSFETHLLLTFLDEPRVQVQGPTATHVTVVSPTHSHTAAVAPEPPADVRLYRRVEIDEGDAGVCQTVAEQLVGRWGREQVSVQGVVPLTTVLPFREYQRIVVPNAGIDQDMILRRKEHQVVPDAVTVCLWGDSTLSDTELLARILDELD